MCVFIYIYIYGGVFTSGINVGHIEGTITELGVDVGGNGFLHFSQVSTGGFGWFLQVLGMVCLCLCFFFFLGHIERFAWSTYLFLCMYIIIDKAIRLGTRALYFVMMRFHAFALCV